MLDEYGVFGGFEENEKSGESTFPDLIQLMNHGKRVSKVTQSKYIGKSFALMKL